MTTTRTGETAVTAATPAGTPVLVWTNPGKRQERGTLIRADVWEGDEQWTYVDLGDRSISIEPWRVALAPEPAA